MSITVSPRPKSVGARKFCPDCSLRGDEVVLDAGCGTGRLTADLLEALPRGRVVGVDLSQNMLNSASEHLKPHFGSRVDLVACDFLHLPFDARFRCHREHCGVSLGAGSRSIYSVNLKRALVREVGWRRNAEAVRT